MHMCRTSSGTNMMTLKNDERGELLVQVNGCTRSPPSGETGLKRFRIGLVFKAHRLLCQLTPGSRVMMKKTVPACGLKGVLIG